MKGHTSLDGCGRCKTVGYKSSITKKVVYPNFQAEKRRDSGFRAKQYPEHQKQTSPLTELPIDMVRDFVVADVLHLIDLGIVKTIIEEYRSGSLTNADAKWSRKEKEEINKYLASVRGPIEIRSRRAIRTFEEFSFWKGREFRVFLLYLSIPIFKCFMKSYLFDHFLLLFCAITICSSEHHLNNYVNIADDCIKHYLDGFKKLYGEEHVTSNFHNFSHLIDDVKRFGTLDKFSAYPFESLLFRVKRLLKTGSQPLAQVAKRLLEHDLHVSSMENDSIPKSQTKIYPILKGMASYSDIDEKT